jgi:hypothetical protein
LHLSWQQAACGVPDCQINDFALVMATFALNAVLYPLAQSFLFGPAVLQIAAPCRTLGFERILLLTPACTAGPHIIVTLALFGRPLAFRLGGFLFCLDLRRLGLWWFGRALLRRFGTQGVWNSGLCPGWAESEDSDSKYQPGSKMAFHDVTPISNEPQDISGSAQECTKQEQKAQLLRNQGFLNDASISVERAFGLQFKRLHI